VCGLKKAIPNLMTASILTTFYDQGFDYNSQYLLQTNALIGDRSNVYVTLMMATG
jgi:hypothetical protein